MTPGATTQGQMNELQSSEKTTDPAEYSLPSGVALYLKTRGSSCLKRGCQSWLQRRSDVAISYLLSLHVSLLQLF